MNSRTLSKTLQKDYKRLNSWRLVGDKWGINKGTAYRIAHGYEPKDAHLRYKLGLPALVPAPVCHTCGEVHVSQCCPHRRKYKRLFDMPSKMLRKMLDERE